MAIEYSADIAERICVAIAAGETLEEVSKRDGFPARGTVYRWLARHPPFYDAYERAREVSAQSLEEEALLLARQLTGPNDFSSVRVSAYKVALEQLRWSAARRDKAKYGQQLPTAAPMMIQINSTLNLDSGTTVDDVAGSIYTIEAMVTPTAPEIEDGQSVDIAGEIEDNDSKDEMAFAPDIRGPNTLSVRKPRTKPRHKSAAATLQTARRFASAETRKKGKKQNGRGSGTSPTDGD